MSTDLPSCIDCIWSCVRPAGLCDDNSIILWVEQVLLHEGQQASEVAINFVAAAEMKGLNGQFRHQEKPTNVLSFPAGVEVVGDCRHLGDIVVCLPVVSQEAHEQGKSLEAHLAHMVVHGMLHLLGYDHEMEVEAEVMEHKEADILRKIGHPNPYVMNRIDHE